MTIVPLSLLLGAIMMWIFRRVANVDAIRQAVNHIQAHLLEFWLFVDAPSLMWKSYRGLFLANGRLLRLLLLPLLILSVPMIPLFWLMDTIYGSEPLPVNQRAIVTVALNQPLDKLSSPAVLQPLPGMSIEGSPVHVFSQHQISWRIRPERPLSAELQIAVANQAITKGIEAGQGVFLVPRKYMLGVGPVKWIEISYPPASISLLGLEAHWSIWFLLFSSIGAACTSTFSTIWRGLASLLSRDSSRLSCGPGLPACLFAATVLLTSCNPASKQTEAKRAEGERAVPQAQPRNLVIVTIDTLRPDHLACYGYPKIQTPNLDKIAASGTLFENAVTPTPLTAPSHASLFTSTYPTVHKVRDTGGFILQPTHITLAKILQQQGWDTAAFVGASVLKKGFGFNQGFSVYDDQMPKPAANATPSEFPERRASEVVDKAVAWLGIQSAKPFFLWVHVFDPHLPYDPPEPFLTQYAGRPYDGEVAYTDQQLGRLFDAIAKKSPQPNTLIAVLSDHGESLSEHGEYTHGVFLYDTTLRIAFLLNGPGVPAGLRVKQQVRNIDLLPTILDLMRSKPPPQAQGVSLTPTFKGKEAPSDSSYSETLYPKINMGWAELRAIRTNRWKYVRAPKPELYDLSQDPSETSNVIASHPSEVQQLEAALKTATGGDQPEQVETAMVDRRTLDQLKSLGYLGGSSSQKFTLTGKGIDPKDRLDVLTLLFQAVSPDSKTPYARRITMLREALSKDRTNPSIYYYLGQEYSKTGRTNDAMKLYQDGIHEGIRTAWLYSRMASLYLRQHNLDEAIVAFERAAQMNPSDYESLSDLGMAYLDSGKPADAERVFKWSLAAGEENALAYNGLGLVAIRKQDLTNARVNFEKAVQLDPDLLEAQLNLGRIYKMIGANARARACFEAFLKKASPSEYAEIIPKIKQELEEMR